MNILKIVGTSVFQIFSLIFLLGYLLGLLNLYFSEKTNYCIMTYMFEYPQFVRLSLPENAAYPQYGLYAYSEGRFTERARKMWFDGIPVLFLPGNSGSHMQARSLASVALRKAVSKGYSYHFDFFTVSYNEELSGLYGGVLQSQTKFAAASITKVLSLYKDNKYTKTVPTTVILIGHSMGGLIAKRLLAYPSTLNMTSLAIALAAPLEAPVVNVDAAMDDYYMLMDLEWDTYINNDMEMKEKKVLISLANGPRDMLMPSGLTSSNDSHINALTTAIPGVWVSPDHVCIVWCKQLVMVINKYLFSIIDAGTEQLTEDSRVLKTRALQYFVANRSFTLDPEYNRPNMTMIADAFWYEDNRRIYQISRPQIDKTTYLMIRLINYPQNRFVAIEAVNVDDKEWIFGCNAKYTYNNHRYCKEATTLSELTRWTGAAVDFGKRKLATINLHNVKEAYPDWSHVIVKVAPTRKPVVLNVDINDHASREIYVDIPSDLDLGDFVIVQETERDSLYYELVLKGLNAVHQAYLLYVEPSAECKSVPYHVSAELHVPWAANHEYYHYFTHQKQNPMKLRLFKSNPNVTYGLDTTEYARVTLLLDPQCTFRISISVSWYYRIAQFARNYSPVLVPYVAGIVLLIARANIMNLRERGTCISVHSALMSESVKPYFALVFARLGTVAFMSIPILSFLFENSSWNNLELIYFTKSLLVLPAYMTALGIVNIAAAAILAVMIFSSQIAHRLLFRIMWRGGSGLAEKLASGLQKVPIVVSVGLVCAAPISCGAASLVAGCAFYSFMLSKMFEEYLEDYIYKLMAKFGSKVCYMFKRTKPAETNVATPSIEPVEHLKTNNEGKETEEIGDDKAATSEPKQEDVICEDRRESETKHANMDEDLNKLNFHVMMFLMWMIVMLVNVPALLTWARNFSYSVVLKPDTSYHSGLIMSACSIYVWQMNGPRKNLKYYEPVSALLFTMAVFILALGPLSLTIVNYGVAFMFAVLTIQQLLDTEEIDIQLSEQDSNSSDNPNKTGEDSNPRTNDEKSEEDNENKEASTSEDCNVCDENRIFNVFKNLREKMSYSENL